MRFSNFAIGIVLISSEANVRFIDAFSAPNPISRVPPSKSVTKLGELKSSDDFTQGHSSVHREFTGDETSEEIPTDEKQSLKGDGLLAGFLGVAPALYASKVGSYK